MKKILLNLILLTLVSVCSAQIIVSGEITSNTTWTSNNIYLLNGWVYVRNGATLTIQPGTLIKGDFDTKGSLIIERGAKIIADGTKEKPIVFTSQKAPGERGYGDWGGLILCGRASVNTPANAGSGTSAGEAIMEGGVGSIYGGGANPNDDDDSGIIRYVRLEFGGTPFQPNSEINGLTLGGVGRGTIIENVMVSYCGDDGFEWFGGTVNCKNLISFNNWDDDLDTDLGFSGRVQYALIIRDPNIADQSGSNAFESDNDVNGTSNTPITSPVFSNVTVIGPYTYGTQLNSNYKRALHLRRNVRTSVFNSVFTNWPVGLLIDNSSTHNNAANDLLRFKNSIICGMDDSLATNTNANPNNISGSFNISTWFNTPSFGNSLVNNISSLMFHSTVPTSPNLLPMAGSPLLSGASFSDPYLANPFFTPTTFRGAFGTEDWTACWAEWDPQNQLYNGAQDYTVTASINIQGGTTVCPGTVVSASANTNAINPQYTWSNATNAATTNFNAPGTLGLTVKSGRGCVATAQPVQINLFNAPSVSVTANGPTSFCTGGSVQLTSSQSTGNAWSNNASGQSINVTQSGSYSVTYTDGNGCNATSNIVNVSVSNSPAPTITTNGVTTFCAGQSVLLTASNSDSYQWSLNGQQIANATSQTFTATQAGAYTVTVTNDNECDGVGTSTFVPVVVNPQPTASFDYDFDFNSFTYSFNNNSTNATSYQWNFGGGQTSTSANPTFTFTTPGANTVTLTAINGSCTDVSTITITNVSVSEEEKATQVVLYPNPTGADAILLVDALNSSSLDVQIYDITGKVVFGMKETLAQGSNFVELPISHLQNGIYLVQYSIAGSTEVIRLAVKK